MIERDKRRDDGEKIRLNISFKDIGMRSWGVNGYFIY